MPAKRPVLPPRPLIFNRTMLGDHPWRAPRSPTIKCFSNSPGIAFQVLFGELDSLAFHNPELFRYEEMTTADYFVLITSKDLSTIHRGLSAPVQPFTSPFIGQSIEEVAAWFEANITKSSIVGYMKRTFTVLEAEAVNDELYTVVSTQDDEVEKLRCNFTMALQNVVVLDMGESMDEEVIGCYKRSDMFMTKENWKLASSGGMYLDGMEVKVDQAWKDFRTW